MFSLSSKIGSPALKSAQKSLTRYPTLSAPLSRLRFRLHPPPLPPLPYQTHPIVPNQHCHKLYQKSTTFLVVPHIQHHEPSKHRQISRQRCRWLQSSRPPVNPRQCHTCKVFVSLAALHSAR